ncbi:MAG: ribosome small subunit-dependent GTPase A [Ruminococcus sp.]|nr:ribosome small subunit-dependent GTPase A [Ruminococcus sp.]
METAYVSAMHRERYELTQNEETFYGRLKTANFYNTKELVEFPTVGDRVEIVKNDTGDSSIIKVLERKSVFKRQNATQGLPDQAVAANFDYVFIVMSLNHDFHMTKLERYLTVAWQSGGTPVIILSKADLCEEKESYVAQLAMDAPGVAVHCISARTGEGMTELKPYVKDGKTIVLLGSSGVGKSSLVNALLGKEEMETGGIREADSQGRHTTTYKQCFLLPQIIQLPNGEEMTGGGKIIDTPGMRKLLMGENAEGNQSTFSDIEELATQCRFSDCQHKKEPGCAVKKALEDGTLDERHWKTYLSLQREEAYSKERKQIMMRKIGKTRKEIKTRGRL